MMPHKRKRKSKTDRTDEYDHDDDDRHSREPSPDAEPKPKKPKKMAPPPLDFSSLLKLAEKKQFEPIQIERKVQSEDDDRRPMTKRQKLEYERERELRERKIERENAIKIPTKKSDSLNRIPKISENREKPNGFGRIPKKSDVVERNAKQELSEIKKRKDSYDSDMKDARADNVRNNNNRGYNGNSTSKEMSNITSRSSDHHSSYEKKTSHVSVASNKIQSRKHSISEEEESENETGRSYSKPNNNNKYENNYDRKPSQVANKIHSRKHSMSEEESDTDEREKSFSRHSKPIMSKSSQIPKNNYPEKRKLDEKYRNGYDNNHSDSQSGSESNKYRPTKYNPENSQYQKYKPESKNNKSDSKYSQPKPSKGYSCQQRSIQSDDEGSNSSQNDRPRNKYEMAQSDSEDENKYKPSKKQSSKDLYKTSSNSILEKQLRRDHSPPPSKPKHDGRVKQSSSNSRPENRKSSSIQPSSKEKKIASLFEASDDEGAANENYKRDVIEREKKLKSNSDRERHTGAIHPGISKFKVPKLNQSGESDRKSQLSSHSSKPMNNIKRPEITERPKVSKPESKSRSENQFSDSKTSSDKGRPSIDKSKEKSKDVNKRESAESLKKNNQNPEDVLKKSASVWSKPCNQPNQPPPKPTSGGLSESQLQRLREMNKKPAPLRPMETPSRLGPPGRPMSRPGDKPSLLKAAAAAAASRTASQKPSLSSGKESQKPSDKQSSRPSEKPLSSSKSSELSSKNSKPKQFPPNDLKPRQFPPSDVRPRQFPPNDLKPRQFPPQDVRRARQFPPTDVRRRSRPREFSISLYKFHYL